MRFQLAALSLLAIPISANMARPTMTWYAPDAHTSPQEDNDVPFGSPAGYQPLHMVSDGPRLIALGGWLPSREPELVPDSGGVVNYEKIMYPVARAWVSDNGGATWRWHPVPQSVVRLSASVGVITTPADEHLLCVAGGLFCSRFDLSGPCKWHSTTSVRCTANLGLTWRTMPPLNSAIVSGSLVQGPAGIFIVGGWLSPVSVIDMDSEDMVAEDLNTTDWTGPVPLRRAKAQPRAAGQVGAPRSLQATDAPATWIDPGGKPWSGVVQAIWSKSDPRLIESWRVMAMATPMGPRLFPVVTWSDKCNSTFLVGGYVAYPMDEPDRGRHKAITGVDRVLWRIDGGQWGNGSAWTAVGEVPIIRHFANGQLPEGLLFESLAVAGVGMVPYDLGLEGSSIPSNRSRGAGIDPTSPAFPILNWVTAGLMFTGADYTELPRAGFASRVMFNKMYPVLFPFDQDDKSQVYTRAMAVYLADRPRSTQQQDVAGMEHTFGIAGVGLYVPDTFVRQSYTQSVLTGYPYVACDDPCPDSAELDGAPFFSTGCRHSPYDAVCFPCSYDGPESSHCTPGVSMITTECGSRRTMIDHLSPLVCAPCAECMPGMIMVWPCSGHTNTRCTLGSPGGSVFPPPLATAPPVVVQPGYGATIFLWLVAALHGAGLLAFLVSKALTSKTSRRFVSGLCAHRLLCPSGIQLPPAPSKAARDAILYAASCCTDSACRAYALTLASVLINAPQDQGAGVLSAALLIVPLSTWVLNTGFVWLRRRVTGAVTVKPTSHGVDRTSIRVATPQTEAPIDVAAWPGKVYRAWVLWLECLSPRTALIGVLARQRDQMLAVRTRPVPDPADELQHHSEPVVSSHSDATPDFGVHAKPAEGHGPDEAYMRPMSSWAAVSILSSDIPCLVSALALVLLTRPSFLAKTPSADEAATQTTCLLAAAASVQFFVSIMFTLHVIGLSRGRISLLKHHPAGLFWRQGTGELAMGQASSNPLAVSSRTEATAADRLGSDPPGSSSSSSGRPDPHVSHHLGVSLPSDGPPTRAMRAAIAQGIVRPGTHTHGHALLQQQVGPDGQSSSSHRVIHDGPSGGLVPVLSIGTPASPGVRGYDTTSPTVQTTDGGQAPSYNACGTMPQPHTGGAVRATHGSVGMPMQYHPQSWGAFRPISASGMSSVSQGMAARPAPVRVLLAMPSPPLRGHSSANSVDSPALSPKAPGGPDYEQGGYRDLELERDMGITCPPMSPSRSSTTQSRSSRPDA